MLLILVRAKDSSSANPIVWVTDSMERIELEAQPKNTNHLLKHKIMPVAEIDPTQQRELIDPIS